MKRRTFLKLAGASVASTTLIGTGTVFYAYQIEPPWIEVKHIPLALPGLATAFRGYRIVQISDLHADDQWMDVARLAQIVQLVNAQGPDLVVVTGDFVSYTDAYTVKNVLTTLHSLKARDGVFYVLGNHDYWNDADSVRAVLQPLGLQELNDMAHTIHRGGAMLHIAGLDDLIPSDEYVAPLWTHEGRLKQLVSSLPAQGPAILLVHEPDIASMTAASGRFALQLSGHSHGGQVRLPLRGPLRLPPLARNFPMGMYRLKNMLQYTNRGLGMVPPYVRFNCRPEMTVFTCT